MMLYNAMILAAAAASTNSQAPTGKAAGGLDTDGGKAGGGEILKYWDQNSQDGPTNLDSGLIKQFLMLPIVRVIIIILILILAVLVIMKIYRVRNPLRGRTIGKELDHLDKVKKHDESIIRANRLIKAFTNMIEHSPLAMNTSNKEYWVYNLTRANVRIPGGSRIMKPEEFNAIVSVIELGVCAIGLIIAILLNFMLGIVLCILAMVLGSSLPMIVIRQKVKEKDLEVTDHFADLYLMLHYVLLASASTPISGIMKSFDKTTDSDEMHRFVDTCVHYIDTYGEFEATNHISRAYREIPEVGKLMRLIKQANEGGDIRAELIGFRNELLAAKKYAIEKRMEKLIRKAKASFNILMPVLIQAVISAMAIYLDDLSLATTLF